MQNTTWLCWSKLAYYFIMNIVGHAFVNQSNLNFYRKSWIQTNSTKYRDFLCVPFLAPIFWILSANFVLMAPEDIDATTPGYRYPWWHVFLYNLFAWTLPYYVGLQFTHFDKGVMTKFVLKPEKMKTWPKILWIIFVSIIVLALAIVGYMIYAYIMADRWWQYIVWTLVVILGFVGITVACSKCYSIHMHHYTVGCIVIVLLGYRSIPCAIVHAFCNGMMIEGGSRWGYDPIWIYKKPKAPAPAAEPAADQSQDKLKPDDAKEGSEMNQIAPAPQGDTVREGEQLEEV